MHMDLENFHNFLKLTAIRLNSKFLTISWMVSGFVLTLLSQVLQSKKKKFSYSACFPSF